jgi:predicted ribosomally synthesized peptide with SipW-like signal peptide
MKKEIALIATAVVTLATLTVGNTLAFFTDQGKVDNVVTMGNVKITLTEPEFADATNSAYHVEFMPGDVIAKDPTITNIGDNDAYIRCKVTVEGGSSEEAGLNETEKKELLQNLNINADDWVLAGDGYYYYQHILPKASSGSSASTLLFNQVKIPLNWGSPDSQMNSKHFKVIISAEAIQADHFTPTKDDDNKIVAWNDTSGNAVQIESST